MSELLTALAVVFIAAGALSLVANFLRLPTVPFMIVAGIGAGLFVDEGLTLELARWGIAFLVFTFGVGVDLKSLGSVVRDGEFAALAQAIVTGGAGYGMAYLLGFDPLNALFFAAAAAFSSTLVGEGLFQIEIRQNLVHGRLARSVHFVQDMLALLLILGLSAEVYTFPAVGRKLALGAGLLVVAAVVRLVLFDWFIRFAEGSQELLLIGSVSILIVFIAAAEFTGVSIVVGAFAAGLAIKRDFARNLGMLNGIESLTDFFAAIFFVTLGGLVAILDGQSLLLAGVLVLLTVFLKPLVTIVVLVLEGHDARSASLTSFGLDQVSEFALIIAIEALLLGVIAPELFDAIILAAAVTMITSGYTRRHDDFLYRKLTAVGFDRQVSAKTDRLSAVRDDLSDHIVVVGYGRHGRMLVQACERIDVPYVIVENDPAMLPALRTQSANVVFGDAIHEYTWTKARAADAQLIVTTANEPLIAQRLCELDFGTDRLVRAESSAAALSLLDRGIEYAFVPGMLASDGLVEQLRLVVEGDTVPEELRERHREILDELERSGYGTIATEEFGR